MLEQTLSLFVLTRRDSYSSWDEWKYNARAHFSRRHMNNYGRMAAVTQNFSHANFQNIFINDFFYVCVSKQPALAKSLFGKEPILQRACSGKEPALAKSLLRHLLKTLCLEHILDTNMTQIIYEQQSRDTDNFFRCMLPLLYSFGLFVCGFLNFLQCFFFFFCFCIFFLTWVKSSWLSFPSFLPSFLSVSLFYFGYFLFFRFVLFCFWFCFLFSFLSR